MSLATTKLLHKLVSRHRGASRVLLSRAMSEGVVSYDYQTLNVTQPSPYVVSVEMNRPKRMNAINKEMWTEIGDVFTKLGDDENCRVVVLTAAGKMFSSGIDLADLSQLASIVYSDDDIGRKSMFMYKNIRNLQDLFTTLEKCRKPIIGCIHNACVGAGVDLITATDIRLCSEDAWFCVKEVDMGIAADVGTLQRLPKVIGSQSLVNDLCLTARRMPSSEAEKCGLVSTVFSTKEDMMTSALEMAANIASKSPVAVQGTKMNLVYSREHSVEEGLDEIARWNMTMLQSEDVMKSAMAAMDKSNTEPPEFENF